MAEVLIDRVGLAAPHPDSGYTSAAGDAAAVVAVVAAAAVVDDCRCLSMKN